MEKQSAKLSLVLVALFTASLAYAASDVQISKGTEIELVDVNNSSIFMGQDYNFTNVTVYGSDVQFTNNSVKNNLSIYPNSSQEINSTLKKYSLNNPSLGVVFKVETEAKSPVKVTYEVDAKKLSSGSYEVYDNSSNLIKTADGSSTITWSETSWSNNTFTIKYVGEQVKIGWTDKSTNENGFKVYSNASGSMKKMVDLGSSSGTGSTINKTVSSSINSGEHIDFEVVSYNQYGDSAPLKGDISIP